MHLDATKIAQTQSGPLANFMSLKHAAGEARHAYYLKKISRKLSADACPNYTFSYLLAAVPSKQYLFRLDLEISRGIRDADLSASKLHSLAYLLTTYTIELRAHEMYPTYQKHLKYLSEKISVQGIINEEVGHLAEKETAFKKWPESLQKLKNLACNIENRLYKNWLMALKR